jgi:hypothetical protein
MQNDLFPSDQALLLLNKLPHAIKYISTFKITNLKVKPTLYSFIRDLTGVWPSHRRRLEHNGRFSNDGGGGISPAHKLAKQWEKKAPVKQKKLIIHFDKLAKIVAQVLCAVTVHFVSGEISSLDFDLFGK